MLVVGGLAVCPQPTAVSRIAAAVRVMSCSGQRRRRPKSVVVRRSPNGRVMASSMLFGRCDEIEAVPVALMVRMALAVRVPSGEAMLEGEMVAVALAGAPVAESWTVCLKMPMGVMVTVVFMLAPRVMVPEVDVKLIEKSGGMAGVIVTVRPAEVEVEKVVAPP